jgi:anti-anti-sigma factor
MNYGVVVGDIDTGTGYVQLIGEYDLSRQPEVAQCFAALPGGRPITIDMRQVTYVDSTFLGELAALRFRLQEIPVTLLGVRPNVARVLEIVKFDRFFVFSD